MVLGQQYPEQAHVPIFPFVLLVQVKNIKFWRLAPCPKEHKPESSRKVSQSAN